MHIERNMEGIISLLEQPDTELFFTGGGREAVLGDIKAALRNQVRIVTLIGEEGSGKTMLCKMLKKQCDSAYKVYKVVFLPQTVKSFEEIVREAARECDLQYPAETTRDDARKIFLELIADLRTRGEMLLLIFDEAEKMYLATLERIRKILDDVNADGEGQGLQLLFSGRESLAGHLEQLELCNFEQIPEKQFVLSALSKKDVWEYLNFCVQDPEGNSEQEVFTQEAADKIASMGMGNLRRINSFAVQALRSADNENSLLVLSGHVVEGDAAEELQTARPTLLKRMVFLQRLPFSPRYTLGGAGAMLLLLLFFIFRGDDLEKHTKDIPKLEQSVESTSPAMAIVPPAQDESPPPSPKETEERVVPEPVVQSEPAEIAVESVDVEEVVDVPPVTPSETAPVQRQEEELTESAPTEPQAQPEHQPMEISPVEIVEKTAADPEIPELTTQSKAQPDKLARIVATSKKQVPLKTVTTPETAGDPVLASLASGGERWKTGADGASFTIQLMALTSDQAEENLKRILLEPEYQKIIDKLVMLKRPSKPPVVLVFYGTYPSMAAARNARNNMPIFLRKHHPYAVSVKGAVEKASAE